MTSDRLRPQKNMQSKSVANLKTELEQANDLLQLIRFAYEGGPAATKQELGLLTLFGKKLADHHGYGTEAWSSNPIGSREFGDRLLKANSNFFESQFGLSINCQMVVTTCMVDFVFSCFDEKATYTCKDGRNFESVGGHLEGHQAYIAALQTGNARRVFEKFRSGKISSKSSPLWWPNRLYLNPILGTRACRLALAHKRFSKWLESKRSDSPLVNLYLDIASTAPITGTLIGKRCPKIGQFQEQLNAHYQRLSYCDDSAYVELSKEGRLHVIAKQPGIAEAKNSPPESVVNQIQVKTKNGPKRDLKTTLSRLDDENLCGRLEVADLLLQWLKAGRKPKMSSAEFIDWLKMKGFAGDFDDFKKAYAWDRKMRSEHSFAGKGRNRAPLREVIRSQEKWITALKVVQQARL